MQSFKALLNKLNKVALNLACAQFTGKGTAIKEEKCLNAYSQADMSLKDDDGNNLLHAAVSKKYYWAALYLLKQGIDINQKNNDELTPFDLVRDSNHKMQLLLLSYPLDLDLNTKVSLISSCLFYAVETNSKHIFKDVMECLTHASKIAGQENIKQIVFGNLNDLGLTALHTATKKGDLELMRKLVAAGASPDNLSNTGLHPVFMIFEALEEYGDFNDDIIPFYLNENASIIHVLSGA